MRAIWLIPAAMLAACATADDGLIVERKDDSVTVKVVDGDTGASQRAAQKFCDTQRKRATLAAVSAERMRFVCQMW